MHATIGEQLLLHEIVTDLNNNIIVVMFCLDAMSGSKLN